MPNVSADPVGLIDVIDRTGVAGVPDTAEGKVPERTEARAAFHHTTGVRSATSKG